VRVYLLSQHCTSPASSERALQLACARLEGVHLVGSTYHPEQERLVARCLAENLEDVLRAAATAQLANVVVTEV
jgi:hypothetical protein